MYKCHLAVNNRWAGEDINNQWAVVNGKRDAIRETGFLGHTEGSEKIRDHDRGPSLCSDTHYLF